MTFSQLLARYVGRTIEVVIPNQMIEGSLLVAGSTTMEVEESPTVYGPATVVTIPYSQIDFVRVLV